MKDNVAQLDPQVARIEAQLKARIDRLDAKVESKFVTLGFALLITLLLATLTLAGGRAGRSPQRLTRALSLAGGPNPWTSTP